MKCVGVLFSLGDVHDRGRAKLGQPVQHAAHTVDVPHPPAVAVRTPLSEGLGPQAHDLEQQLTGVVRVVVSGNELRRDPLAIKQIVVAEPREYGLLVVRIEAAKERRQFPGPATSLTRPANPPVLALIDRQRGPSVVMLATPNNLSAPTRRPFSNPAARATSTHVKLIASSQKSSVLRLPKCPRTPPPRSPRSTGKLPTIRRDEGDSRSPPPVFPRPTPAGHPSRR